MNSDIITYECTPRQLRKHIQRIIDVGLVPFIQGSPGIGKSAITRSVAKMNNLKLIDHRLSTSAPEDLSGLPNFKADKATFSPFDIFPIETDPIPEDYDGWLIFLDEFNSAIKTVQAAAYKLILDRMVGQYKLHPKVKIIAAGNLSTDRAIVNPLGTAMQSRLIHVKLGLNHNEWMQDVALAEGYDKRIIAFLNYKPSYLFDFHPEHNELTFCCPRTWEFMNLLLGKREYGYTPDGHYEMELDVALYAGTITSGVATEFIQFTKVFEQLPNLNQIIADPQGTNLPGDKAVMWATVSHILEYVDDKNFEPLGEYISRFTTEFRMIFFRSILSRKIELKAHPAFRKMVGELSKYLND